MRYSGSPDYLSLMSKHPPLITPDLIEYLVEQFPNKLPDEVIEKDELAILIGQQKLIKHLKAIRERQEKSGLTASILNRK